jgi:hypothetical protein
VPATETVLIDTSSAGTSAGWPGSARGASLGRVSSPLASWLFPLTNRNIPVAGQGSSQRPDTARTVNSLWVVCGKVANTPRRERKRLASNHLLLSRRLPRLTELANTLRHCPRPSSSRLSTRDDPASHSALHAGPQCSARLACTAVTCHGGTSLWQVTPQSEIRHLDPRNEAGILVNELCPTTATAVAGQGEHGGPESWGRSSHV